MATLTESRTSSTAGPAFWTSPDGFSPPLHPQVPSAQTTKSQAGGIPQNRQRPAAAELGVALALIAWRLAAGSPSGLWKDWILVVSAFWIYTRYKSGSPAWPARP